MANSTRGCRNAVAGLKTMEYCGCDDSTGVQVIELASVPKAGLTHDEKDLLQKRLLPESIAIEANKEVSRAERVTGAVFFH
jgi:hypothetical protein